MTASHNSVDYADARHRSSRTITFTSLQRDPNHAARLAEDGPVTVTRRSNEDLVLVSAQKYGVPDLGMSAAAQLVAATAELKDVTAAVQRVFPWVEFLSEVDRGRCIAELERKLLAAASMSSYGIFQEAVDGWEATAAAIADGAVPDGELEWLRSPSPVERPS
ncbi:MAG: hypothetical protein L0K27_03155 [Corynebacterium nuruki]|jgi:hypothetical protein|nr:hypothetical protein [Corynebacterium nuruki]